MAGGGVRCRGHSTPLSPIFAFGAGRPGCAGPPAAVGKQPPPPAPCPPTGCISHDFCFYCFYSSTEKPSCNAAVGGDAPSPNLHREEDAWVPSLAMQEGGHGHCCPFALLVRGCTPSRLLGRLWFGGPWRVVGTSRAPWCCWAGWAQVGPGDVGLRPSGAWSWWEREDGGAFFLGGRCIFMLLFPLLPH